MEQRSTIFKGKPFPLTGSPVKVGDKAPDFACVNSGLETVTLAQTAGKARFFSVVPSLDTPVCSMQTKKFDDAVAVLKDKIGCYTISLDLPFAQKRWCGAFGVDKVKMLSDHRDGSFGSRYGTLIKELRIESRAIFVLDRNNTVRYAEYVKEVAEHPNYDAALSAARAIATAASA